MKKIYILQLLLFVSTFEMVAQDISVSVEDSIFSKSVKVSLLTIDPGSEIYSVWGHTAIRIKDEPQKIDAVYNYGTFDFDTPYFLLKFLRGKLNYSLDVSKYYDVYKYYEWEERSIFEQDLNLSYLEKEKLYKLLEENLKGDNKYYKYDFLFDNCSTRPLQIIEKSLNDELVFPQKNNKKTFRQLLDAQIIDYRWLDFGIDLIVGSNADDYPDARQSAFLPLQLKKDLDKSFIGQSNTVAIAKREAYSSEKIVSGERQLLDIKSHKSTTPKLLQPIWIFSILLLLEIVIFISSWRRKKKLVVWYDYLWFAVAAIGGLVITFMWFFTEHQATKNNWNYMWLNPLYLFVFFNKNIVVKRYILILATLFAFLALMGFGFLPQQLNPAVIPIIGILILKLSKHGILYKYFN